MIVGDLIKINRYLNGFLHPDDPTIGMVLKIGRRCDTDDPEKVKNIRMLLLDGNIKNIFLVYSDETEIIIDDLGEV